MLIRDENRVLLLRQLKNVTKTHLSFQTMAHKMTQGVWILKDTSDND